MGNMVTKIDALSITYKNELYLIINSNLSLKIHCIIKEKIEGKGKASMDRKVNEKCRNFLWNSCKEEKELP